PLVGVTVALQALRRALKTLATERAREGRELRRDFETRLETIAAAMPRIEELAAAARETMRASFETRMRELLSEVPINEKRLHDEALGVANHGDISEEMTRLKVHLKAMTPLLGRAGAVGKSVEFLLQELNREINTIGAKSQDARMSQIAVAMKGEIEKMREQVQNVE
ncbi:MAG: endoribonuclease YicC domain-containing protein, partial [Candidatus Binataceae bacterium]